MNRTSALALVLALTGVVAACDDDSDGGGASQDGGQTDTGTGNGDTGPRTDTGPGTDAEPRQDLGESEDLGPGDDVGPGRDAETQLDEGTGDGGLDPDQGIDADQGPEPIETTATFTFDGNTETVVPEVRRGLQYVAIEDRQAFVLRADQVSLDCGSRANPEDGGRTLLIDAFGISGNFANGECADRAVATERRLLNEIRLQCQGQATCSFDPSFIFEEQMVGCQLDNIVFGVQHRCSPLLPAPSFVIEAQTPTHSFAMTAMDGLGEVDCAGNGARFFVDGQPQALAPESTCTVNITRRTARGLAGSIQATLVGGDGVPRPFAVDFDHGNNVLRPIAAINTGTDLCASNTITHTVEEVGGEIIDVFVSDALGCQANPNATLPPFELRWRRTPAGQIPERLTCGVDAAINLRVGATNTEFGPPGCRSAFRVSEAEERRTLVLYEATLCEGPVTCAAPLPNLYLQYDLRSAR